MHLGLAAALGALAVAVGRLGRWFPRGGGGRLLIAAAQRGVLLLLLEVVGEAVVQQQRPLLRQQWLRRRWATTTRPPMSRPPTPPRMQQQPQQRQRQQQLSLPLQPPCPPLQGAREPFTVGPQGLLQQLLLQVVPPSLVARPSSGPFL